MTYIISVNSRDGKPVVPPFVSESLDGLSDFVDAARAVGGVVIVDSIASFSSPSVAKIAFFDTQKAE